MLKSFKNLIGNKQSYLVRKTVPEKETVFHIFKEVIRDEFGIKGLENFMPDYFSNGTLFVKAQNSVWSCELWTNRENIIKKINQKIGENCVEKIKMK
jgi:hypothetical protein